MSRLSLSPVHLQIIYEMLDWALEGWEREAEQERRYIEWLLSEAPPSHPVHLVENPYQGVMRWLWFARSAREARERVGVAYDKDWAERKQRYGEGSMSLVRIYDELPRWMADDPRFCDWAIGGAA